jgi:hypothetical protein
MRGNKYVPTIPSSLHNDEQLLSSGPYPDNGQQRAAGGDHVYRNVRNSTTISNPRGELDRQANSFQAKFAKSRKDYYKLRNLYRQLKEEHADLEDGMEDAKSRYDYVTENLIQPYA